MSTSLTLPAHRDVYAGRVSAEVPEGAVVFLIGMRVNRLLLIRRWLPVFFAMPNMLRELYRQKERGFLGARTWINGRNVMVQQYWRTMDDLMAYAVARDGAHLPAWKAFNRRVGNDGTVGIWHEAYVVHPDQSHLIYRNMPAFGLAAATGRVPQQPDSVPPARRFRRLER